MAQNILESPVGKAEEMVSDFSQALEAVHLLEIFLAEVASDPRASNPNAYAAGRDILEAEPKVQIQIVLTTFNYFYSWALTNIQSMLCARNLPWTAVDLERFLDATEKYSYRSSWSNLLWAMQHFVEQGHTLTPTMQKALQSEQEYLSDCPGADSRKMHIRITALLGEDAALPDAGETWANAMLADIAGMSSEEQTAWKRLFARAQDSEGARPNRSWRKEAKEYLAAVGEEAFREHLVRWFALVTTPPLETVQYEYNNEMHETEQHAGTDRNISLLKGLAWMCADQAETEIARALAKLIEGCLKKLPGLGPWAGRAASAAVWSLTEMNSAEAIGQLGRLKTKVTFRTVLNQIEKGLETAAQRAGVTKADLEDLSVPTYGFGLDGIRRESFGDCAAIATITATGDVQCEWFGANGKAVKAVPAEVKKNHANALKAFKADMDTAGKMLTALKARFDSFYLPERVWKFSDWQARFGEHPLLRQIANRLIWHFSAEERKTQGIWNEAKKAIVDVRDEPIPGLTETVEVRLWHPIGFEVDTVLQWRDYMQQHEIMQPFKQAYREVYILTEAELRTGTYSNRFAGHLLKQHQMNALAALQGWRNKLRLMVDDTYPPVTRDLPELGLRAEFWVEGAGDNYGRDTTESGAYLYLATDQVRFYRLDASENYAHAGGGGYTSGRWNEANTSTASLPLTEVPALVFSEILRDVDMFVGVCSVGNDPTWQDGGPQGQYRTYWQDYSFGDLSATAQTRRVVLERLLPRLKIASRCSLVEKFLIVRGDLRTYKIHLGSGNILMEPNDQYLCIVQDRSASKGDVPVNFLPFEGDARMALILSKAFLLAEDTKITDPTITRQIKP